MPFPNPTACNVPLTQVPGTGFNTYAAPIVEGAEYKAITNQLLYEILQGILLLVAAAIPPGMVPATLFTIGDGGPVTPVAGTTSFRLASFADKEVLVLRNGVQMQYFDGTTHLQIIRFNDHVNGGFDLDPASGLTFQNGDNYQLFPIGLNTTSAP